MKKWIAVLALLIGAVPLAASADDKSDVVAAVVLVLGGIVAPRAAAKD